MRKDVRMIYIAFEGKLVGNTTMKKYVCEVVALMERKIIDHITGNCWFFGSMEDAWAFTFTGNDLKNQHLIFLSDELFMQPLSQIYYTIAHEIGHVINKHKNSILERQSKEEIKQQEKEADIFAKKYINKKN